MKMKLSKLFIIYLLLYYVINLCIAQEVVQHIDESQIKFLSGEETFVLDRLQNYDDLSEALLKRYIELTKDITRLQLEEKENKNQLLSNAKLQIEELSQKMRYLDTFNFIVDEPYYITDINSDTKTFQLSRQNGNLLSKYMLIGNVDTYRYRYDILTKTPPSINISSPIWMFTEVFQKAEKDSSGAIEVAVTIKAKPEFNMILQQKGDIHIRALELKVWYQGKVICTYDFKEREERTYTFSVKGVPITTYWKLVNGRPENITEAYYPNGTLYSKGQYYDASLTAQNGRFEYSNPEGKLIRIEHYTKGIPNGEEYDLYYGNSGLASIIYKQYDFGMLSCHESINIINGKPRRVAVTSSCSDESVESLLEKLEVTTIIKE